MYNFDLTAARIFTQPFSNGAASDKAEKFQRGQNSLQILNSIENTRIHGGNMSLKSKFFKVVSVFALASIAAVAVFADTIRLKDGSVIKGKIVSFGGGRFTVVVGDGARARQLNYNASEVESISFDNAAAVQTASYSNNGGGQPTNQQTSTNTNSAAAAAVSAAKVKPITINVRVLADNTSNGWTNSGFVVRAGQRIRITGAGRVSLGVGRYATAEGIASLPDTQKLMPQSATGGLIAVVGDDNNDFIFVGGGREFTATRDGALFLGVNEGNLNDNSGAFDVRIEIQP